MCLIATLSAGTAHTLRFAKAAAAADWSRYHRAKEPVAGSTLRETTQDACAALYGAGIRRDARTLQLVVGRPMSLTLSSAKTELVPGLLKR